MNLTKMLPISILLASSALAESQVTFYRPSAIMYGKAVHVVLSCDSQQLAFIGSGKKYVTNLAPGEHVCYVDKQGSVLKLDVKDGEKAYVQIHMDKMQGWLTTTTSLKQLPEAIGVQQSYKLKGVEKKNEITNH